jgi:type I restriction enzyme S subunit
MSSSSDGSAIPLPFVAPAEWSAKPLQAVCTLITDGDWIELKDQGGRDFRLLQISNVGLGEFVETENYRWITEETFHRLRCTEINVGDVLVARMPEPAGRCWYVKELPWRAVTAVDVAIVRTDQSELDGRFLSYYLNSPQCLGVVASLTTGTTRLRIRRADIGRLTIPLPPLSEQRAIAEVLGALDDKIEANRRVAEYGRRLAIAEGIDRLAKFPGRLVALEQVATMVKGLSYRSEDLVPGGGWLVSLKCVGRDGSFQAKGLKPFSGVAKVSQFVEEGDILVAQTDLTQRAEVIGRPIRVAKLGMIGHLVASLDFVIVRPESGLTNETLFAVLSQQEFREHALGYCNGTTVLHMNSRGVPSFEFALPPPEGIAQITSVMRPLLKRSDTAQRESQLLEKLRDTLLPKLLSGELRVRDAEPLVEEFV